MSNLQSTRHPDADELSAFLEQALPPHERELTLAHLAGCAHCRGILALALSEAEPSLLPQPARRPWFAGWNLALPIGALLAAAVTIAVYLRGAPAPADRPAALPAQMAAAQPRPAVADLRPEPPTIRPQPASPAPAPKPVSATPSPARQHYAAAAAAPPVDTSDAAPALFGTVRPPSPNAQADVLSAPPPRIQLGSASPPSPVAAAQAAGTGIGQSAVGGPYQQQMQNSALALQSVKARNAVLLAALPGGLPALSTASSGHRSLAIDTASHLFASVDDGRTWTPVKTPWQGRAVRVALAASPSGMALSGTVSPSDAAESTINTDAAAAGTVTDASTAAAKPSVLASLSGKVTDQSGASVAGATVRLNGTARSTATDATGHYLLPGLAPGSYRLQAQAPGFATQELHVSVEAARQSVVDLTLQIGAVAETVGVQGAARDIASAPARKVATTPPALFEITTETGERWTSPDGHLWTRP
jgi:hypothetical protein